MRYQGGKARLAKYIVPILEAARDGRPFVEPFCGACSITARMSGERHASDLHRGLITMWRAVQRGWEPPEELSREQWEQLREANDHDNPLTAFAAFGCSYRGAEWAGYASGRQPDPARGIHKYIPASRSAARGIARKRDRLSGVVFRHADALALHPADSLVYCDPPYKGTRGYSTDLGRAFWGWCEAAVSRGCTVFVSEYNAPLGEIIWERERTTLSMSHTTRAHATERLYRIG